MLFFTHAAFFLLGFALCACANAASHRDDGMPPPQAFA